MVCSCSCQRKHSGADAQGLLTESGILEAEQMQSRSVSHEETGSKQLNQTVEFTELWHIHDLQIRHGNSMYVIVEKSKKWKGFFKNW
jgi:hypothetical protein